MPAPKICSHPRCPNLQPCPDHQPEPWAGSTRRTRTVSGSRQQKRARHVMRTHDGVCHWCGKPGADQADHIQPLAEGGADTLENLKPIHSRPCHAEKTAHESARARTPH